MDLPKTDSVYLKVRVFHGLRWKLTLTYQMSSVLSNFEAIADFVEAAKPEEE